jgi:hypothetical protein
VAAGALAAVTAVPALGAPRVNVPASPLLYRQTFAGATVSPGKWIVGDGHGSSPPCLTARHSAAATGIQDCNATGGDAAGNGVLRLTTNRRQQSAFVLYTKPLNATAGLNISFDMYQFHSTTRRGGADGIGFVLIDGAQSPLTAGDAGGWLGYRGLAGALLGVGFDEWGNFSNRALWGSGPDGLVPDSIVVRGAGVAGYPYLTGVRTPALARDDTAERGAARRHVVIKISTAGVMTVSVDFGHGPTPAIKDLELDNVPGQPPMPPTVKFGFTAATGDDTAVHEISDLTISALRPDLHTTIRPAGKFRAGGSGDLIATVSSDPSGGPTTGTVTATIKVPGAMTPQSAQGPGWNCAISGQQVSCPRGDVLQPGRSFPPIDVTTSVASNSPRRLTVQSSANTPRLFLSPANSSQARVRVLPPPPAPDLSVKITPVTPLVPGGTGKLRLDTSNAPRAGTTKGPVTLTYRAPAGTTVNSGRGKGWTCARQPAKVVCARPDPLQGGASFPPVYVTTSICRKASCSLRGVTVTVQTPGAGPVTAAPNLPVSPHSALGLSLSSNPARPVPGYDMTFTAVVTNGGPTDVANAEVIVRVPRHFTGHWTCKATRGSGCPARLGAGRLGVRVYVARGGTVTLTATGEADRAAVKVPVSARLTPPGSYTDLYCSHSAPCTASGNGAAGQVAK